MLINSIHKAYMELALEQAYKGFKKGEVPVGAVIVQDQKIISKAYNQVEQKQNACFHAEIIAINLACKKLKTKFLNNCILYVTLEPCAMCMHSIHSVRIKKVFYSASILSYAKNINFFKSVELYQGVLEKESRKLLDIFFKDLRQKT